MKYFSCTILLKFDTVIKLGTIVEKGQYKNCQYTFKCLFMLKRNMTMEI